MLPVPLLDAFRDVSERFGEKRGWAVASAAVLMLLQLDEDERVQRVTDMVAMDIADTLADAIASIRNGQKAKRISGGAGSSET